MKKFLFTLLTLFMASSAFAGDYFYIDNITLTKEEAAAGCKKIANVKAHFDNAVSAWQVDLTLPDGVTIDNAMTGADMTLTYLDKFTDGETMDTYYAENTYTPTLANSNGYTRFIVSVFTTVEYDQDGNSYGICWRPGDYDVMWRVRLVIPAGFKGGDLNVHTAPSGPAKPYPGLTTSDKVPSDHVTAIRIKADTPEIAVDGDQYKKTVTITAEEGATIYYSTDGESYTVYNEPVVFDKAGTYTVYAYAEGPGEEPEKKSKSDVATSEQFTIAEQVVEQTAKPNIVKEDVEGGVKVTATGEGTVVMYVDGKVVENPYFIAQTDEEKTYTVTATAQEEGKLISETATLVVTVPAKPAPAQTAKPNIAQEETEDAVIVTATGEGTVVMYVDGKVVENPCTIAKEEVEKTYTVTATAQEEGKTISETATLVVTVPAKPAPAQTAKPNIAQEDVEGGVKVTATGKGTVKLYVDGVEVQNPYIIAQTDEEKTYEVTATAQEEGKTISETATLKVTVPAKPAPAPEPTFNWDPDTYTMEAVCQGHTVVLMANGAQVSNPYTVAQTTEDQTIEFSAYTVANADESGNSETIKQTVTVPAKPLLKLTGNITFNVTQGNKNNEAAGIVTATYDGPETGVTVKIVGDPTKVAAATSAGVRLNDYGTYQVKAVATATGYADLEEEGEVTWEEPQTAAPEITVTEDGLTVKATGEGTVTLYVVDANGNETAIVNPTTFAQKDEAYTVNLKAVAHVDGAKDGVATKTIIIPAKSTEPGTGVNELVDGKAVKSVRYFNMAGQEMQEVNGVTIVVTTYTDGTTSAVKVMK